MATSTQSIREIVSTQSSAAAVLQRFDIDLCSLADASLEQACAALQLSADQVLEKLSDAATREDGAAPADLAGYSMSRLIQHIVRTHHQYVRRELPRLTGMAETVAGRHGMRTPELDVIKKHIDALRADLLAHLQKEEQILFPFIAEMDQDSAIATSLPHACFRTIAQPISMMISEHDSAESHVAQMRDLSHGFKPPAWGCPTYIAFYAGLGEFAADLRRHVHLEDDILFPRAIALESTLSQRR